MLLRRPAFAAVCLSAVSQAQGFQCSLLGTHDQHGPDNDIWGYRAPNGKECALVGATTGTVVIACSNPAAPIERGWFPWLNSTWRDISATPGLRVRRCRSAP